MTTGRASLAWAWALAPLLLACPRGDAPAADDRTLRLLQQEKDRLAAGTSQPGGPPMSADRALADAVAQPQPARELVLPEGAALQVGSTRLTVKALVSQQAVSSAKLTLTTPETFLKVTLSAETSVPARLDMSQAQVITRAGRHGVARDAQRVGGGSPLAFTLTPGPAQPVVLYFEVPPVEVGPGLTLALIIDGGTVEARLQ